MKKISEEQAEHLKRCLKKITLKFLKTGWDAGRIKDLKLSKTLIVGSDKFLYLKEWKKRGYTSRSHFILNALNCIWSNDHDKTLTQKRKYKEHFKHIFISQICDVAVAEYTKVCRMLDLNRIFLVSFKGDKAFFRESLKVLKIPGVKVEIIEW